MKTPIAFIIFNRPNPTKQVFEAIRKAKPEVLFVIADGPRNEVERPLCEAVRTIIETVDWKCDVRKKYADENLGCGVNESRGLDWVFENYEQAIILEDDCLPDPTFFPFCEAMLEKYKNDERVMHISGNFFQQKNHHFSSNKSYYASILPHVWGWATWRRAWNTYDYDLKQWPEVKKNNTLEAYFNNPGAYEYWASVWDRYHLDNVNNYDAKWVFACMINKGICFNPTVNLIENIGFGPDATHTKVLNDCAHIATKPMNFPLRHPVEITTDRDADNFTFKQNFGIDKKLRHQLLRPIKNAFPNLYWKLRNKLR